MFDVLEAIGKKLFDKHNFKNNDDAVRSVYKIKSKLEKEMARMYSVEKTLEMFAGDDFDSDPIKRVKNIVKGKYDKYVRNWPLYEAYKETCNLLIKKFAL